MCKSADAPLQDELLPCTSQLRTSQPSLVAIQVGHISHVLQMINTAARLVRAQMDFCTSWGQTCLLYTSDAADEEDSVDLGGRRIIKKKKKKK